jgi:Ca2+/Na+ antiporter
MSLVVGLGAFGGGVWLLVESVEGLIKSLHAWALAAGLSGVLVGALVLGFDVEATAAGVAATLDDLPGTALGASVGAAIFLVTVGLGTAALIAPFAVRPPVTLLAAAAAATALSITLAADGRLSRVDGGLLLASFFPLVAAVVLRRPPTEPQAGERPARPKLLVLNSAVSSGSSRAPSCSSSARSASSPSSASQRPSSACSSSPQPSPSRKSYWKPCPPSAAFPSSASATRSAPSSSCSPDRSARSSSRAPSTFPPASPATTCPRSRSRSCSPAPCSPAGASDASKAPCS